MDDEHTDLTYNPEGRGKNDDVLEIQNKLRPLPVVTEYKERPSSMSSDEYNDFVHHHRIAAKQTYKRRITDSRSSSIEVVESPGNDCRSTETLSPPIQDSVDSLSDDIVVSETLYSVSEEIKGGIQSPETNTQPPAGVVQNVKLRSSSSKENTTMNSDSEIVQQHANVSSSDSSLEEKELNAEKLHKIYRMKAKRKANEIDEDLQLKLKQIKRRLDLGLDAEKRRLDAEQQLKWKEMSELETHEALKRKRKIWENYQLKCIIKDITPEQPTQ